jgi:hypothetical protein
MNLFKHHPSVLAGIFLLAAARMAGAQSALTAFPGAEGFAADTTGGRGGEIYHVTNLNDSGPGSFREGVSRAAKPRTIVFDVGGYISLKSILSIGNNLTIAGQTAPGDGIGLRDSEVSLSRAHNVIIRYVRFRQGLAAKQEKKGDINMVGAHDIIFDHVSMQWGRWDTLDMTGSSDITIQDSIIGPGVAPQRFGCICESDNVSFLRDLWISNHSRNPKSKGHIQYVNNVIYNWGVTGYVGGHSEAVHAADLIGNYFIKGPSSSDHFAGEFKPTDHLYQTGNFVDLDRDGQLNGHPVTPADFGGRDGPTLSATPLIEPPKPVTVLSATDAYQKVVAGVGASLHRDAVDRRLIEDLTSLGKRGQTVRDPAEMGGFGELAGGTAPLESGGDGIADSWKIANGLDPKTNVANQLAASGRTELEEYLNWLAAGHSPAN